MQRGTGHRLQPSRNMISRFESEVVRFRLKFDATFARPACLMRHEDDGRFGIFFFLLPVYLRLLPIARLIGARVRLWIPIFEVFRIGVRFSKRGHVTECSSSSIYSLLR
jgi:hypothetical protein